MTNTSKKLFDKRKERTRINIAKCNKGLRPRLSVFRSNKAIYVQLIDEINSNTLVSVSTLDKEFKDKHAKGSNIEAAKIIGREIASKAIKIGITEVVFDKGGYLFHGRVKALAEAAREVGLKF